jgi:hypothetical protein
VAPEQMVGYRARLWRGDVLLGSVHGAFCIAEGQAQIEREGQARMLKFQQDQRVLQGEEETPLVWDGED